MNFKRIKNALIILFCIFAIITGCVKLFNKPKADDIDEYITFYQTSDLSDQNSIKDSDISKDNADNTDKADNKVNDGLISINKGTIEELMKLPGIGQTKAEKIIEYRNQYGGFVSIDELTQISGIGDKTLEKLRPYIKL